jgi:gamma-glutamyl hercynylcysteine S-oxide synthase
VVATEAVAPPPTSLPDGDRRLLTQLDDVRTRTLRLVDGLDEAALTAVHDPIMSPLAWDLGHIAAYEDLWLCHRDGCLPLLRPELAALYDAFETPRAVRGEIEALGPADARGYMARVRDRTRDVLERRGAGNGTLWEMVLRHELQHSETMRQTMAIAGLLPLGEPPMVSLQGEGGWIALPGGEFAMGAGETGFASDNERPRHEVRLRAFAIARVPVSNGSWMHFSEGGGYERREWWSREGWAWKEEYDITHHPAVEAGPPDGPACHVSWFEADAFARAHGARLPTEAEWERAATWDHGDGDGDGDGGRGPLRALGHVWEWTGSWFGGYPGFAAHPYREYSEVFFGERYRVLRGGSWATDPRVATLTFRNWDLPQRRQIFAGVRLARDLCSGRCG